MVKNVNAALDDADYQRAKDVKDQLGLTWSKFIMEATRLLGEEADS